MSIPHNKKNEDVWWSGGCSHSKRRSVGRRSLKWLARRVDSWFLTQACLVAHASQGARGKELSDGSSCTHGFAHTAEAWKRSRPVIGLTGHMVNINVSEKHGRKKEKRRDTPVTQTGRGYLWPLQRSPHLTDRSVFSCLSAQYRPDGSNLNRLGLVTKLVNIALK